MPIETTRGAEVDPFDSITDLFLGPERTAMLDDLPLPPLKSEATGRPDPKLHASQAAPRTPPAPRPLTPDRGESLLIAAAKRAREVGASPERIAVESLVVGHLPAPASAWVYQYARWRHRTSGEPIALLRVRGTSCSVDLHSELPPAAGDLPSSLPQAIALATGIARRWILSVDDVSEGEVATLNGVGRVVILTAPHHTAVVGAYQALRGLSHLAQQLAEASSPALTIAVVGGPEPKALSVGSRLAQAANVFLGRDLETVMIPERLTQGRSTTLFVGECEDPMHAVGMVLRSLPSPAAKGSPTVESGKLDHPKAEAAKPVLAGMHVLAVRCPHAPMVEISSNDAGELHVLAAADSASGVDRAVSDLVAASSWVRTHLPLISACVPELARRVAAGPAPVREHLVTPDAKAARKLLDSPVKVHLRVPGATGLIELN